MNISFLPMEGCVNFCSFCAENAGRKTVQHPFPLVKRAVGTMPWRVENAALYNASDGLNYRWKENGRVYTIADVADLFIETGARRILFSTPGIPVSEAGDHLLKRLSFIKNGLFIFSLNREHLKNRDRLEGFIRTAGALAPHVSHQFRLVYTSPGERARLLDLWSRHFRVSSRFPRLANGGALPETVPAVPIGRGRRFYFTAAGSLPADERGEGEARVMDLYRREPYLEQYRFMTAGDYPYFLKHAAVQFNGFYVILVRPGSVGAELSIKTADFSRIDSTHGRHFSTEYRYDADRGGFFSTRDRDRELKLAVVPMERCTVANFLSFLDRKESETDRAAAGGLFTDFMKSDFMTDKNRLNENTRMIIMNKEYRNFYLKTVVTDTLSFRPGFVQKHSLKKGDIQKLAREIFAFLSDIRVA